MDALLEHLQDTLSNEADLKYKLEEELRDSEQRLAATTQLLGEVRLDADCCCSGAGLVLLG